MGQAASTESEATPQTTTSTTPEDSLLDVELQIVSAKDIAAGDILEAKAALNGHLSSSDGYVIIEVEGQKVAWTRPIFETLEPVWNETFYFKNVNPNALCKLYLLDKDVGQDDPLGEAQFKAANTDGAESSFELPIKRGDERSGSIAVKVKSHPVPATADAHLMQYGPVHYSVHSNFVTGLITESVTDDDKIQSLAYHVQLHNIQEVMPQDFEWNKEHTPVQKIFSPDHPEAPVLRKAIQTEHALIYKHDADTVYGEMSSADDFFKLVHEGRRQDKQVLFTYAIIGTGWYFSETGAAFFKDMLSKHMLHCGAQFSVKYAGEFHIDKDDDGKFTLWIDNNSGTYAPPKEALPQLRALLENNFPGIAIKTSDRKDPGLKETRKEIFAAWE